MTRKTFPCWQRGVLAALLLACAAKALVDCLVKTGGNMNALLKCAGDYDPKAKAFIDIYFAATKPDYVKLIELAGPVVACQGASVVLPPGPPKDILCSELLAPLVKSSFSVVAQIYQAAVDQNWAKLLDLTGPGLGCEVIDKFVGGIPGQELLCGTVAKVIEEGVKLAKDAAKTGKKMGEFLWDTGSDLISGVGGALEGACEGIGLCDDDDGNKLMSGNQYYTYRLFPLIHDRVLARLVKGQQQLGHDAASLQACLTYYGYDTYAKHPALKQLAPAIKAGCEALGARLHKEADAMAVRFAAAPAPYFEASVKPFIPAMAVAGKGSVASLRKAVTSKCVGVMHTQLPIPEPSKPGSTAWDQVCKQVGDLFQSAYPVEEKQLAATIQQLAAQGCKKQQKSVYENYELVCSSYEGFAACQTAYTPKPPCALVKNKADVALADGILKQLGTKRCKLVDEVKTQPCPKYDGHHRHLQAAGEEHPVRASLGGGSMRGAARQAGGQGCRERQRQVQGRRGGAGGVRQAGRPGLRPRQPDQWRRRALRHPGGMGRRHGQGVGRIGLVQTHLGPARHQLPGGRNRRPSRGHAARLSARSQP